jgi:hypothetical protein
MEGGMGAGGTYNGSATKEGPKSQEPWVALPAPVPRRVSGSKAIEEGVRIINGSIKDVTSSSSKERLLRAEGNTSNFIARTSRKGRSSKATEKAARRVVDENEGIKKGVSRFPMTKASKHFISRACIESLRLPYTRSNKTRIIARILVSLIIEQRSIETTFQNGASPTGCRNITHRRGDTGKRTKSSIMKDKRWGTPNVIKGILAERVEGVYDTELNNRVNGRFVT